MLVPIVTVASCLVCCRPADVSPPKTEADPAPASTPTPEPTPTEPAQGPRREARGEPPVEGLEYWADTPLTTDAFVARARSTGIEIEHTVEVSSVQELLGALAPNTAIVLAPGRHEFLDSNVLGEPEEQAALPDWSTLSPYYDGGEIHDLHDLVIVGAGPEPTVLLQPDGYAHALNFRHVRNLGLHNLVLGHHPEQGWCRGGVVKVIDSSNVLITDSTLFGSGTEGLTLIGVDGLRFQDGVITNCSEQFSTISQSRGISLERVRVAGNKSDLLRGFAIYRSTVSISDSTIADNKPMGWSSPDSYNLLFAIDGSFDWAGWFEDEPHPVEPTRTKSEVVLHNTTIDGERFDRTL